MNGPWALARRIAIGEPRSLNDEASTTLATKAETEKPDSVNCRVSWSQHPDLNRGPADYESAALPTELCRPKTTGSIGTGARNATRKTSTARHAALAAPSLETSAWLSVYLQMHNTTAALLSLRAKRASRS